MSKPPSSSHSPDSEKLHAELEKLRLEVADLKRWKSKAVIAIVSAFLAPVVSIGTFVAASSASRWAERKHNDDALFGKVAQDFASPSLSRRISAISAMESFTLQHESGWWGRPKAEQAAANDRARNAISLLVNSLDTEADPTVVNAILNAVLKRGDLSLHLLKEANRRASVEFARSAGIYAGVRMLHDTKRSSLDDDELTQSLRSAVELALNEQIARSNQLFDTSGDFNGSFIARRFLYSQPYRHFYERQRRFALGDSTYVKSTVPSQNDVHQAEAGMLQKALFLEATSWGLVRALNVSGDAKLDRDWHGIALVCGQFPDPADFSNIDLRDAYLYATTALQHVDFRNTQLDGTDLTGFNFEYADLAGTTYKNIKLCHDSPFVKNGMLKQNVVQVDEQATAHKEVDPRCQ